jgi:hypothetical protein
MKVELDAAPGSEQHEEMMLVTLETGEREQIRLHDYARVYDVPGLYEEVVQRRLQCASPVTLATGVVQAALQRGIRPAGLSVLDLGAGNGILGEELQARGVQTILGTDNVEAARRAALRDRPNVYAEYFITGSGKEHQLLESIPRHGLNSLVAAGALGPGHIPVDSLHGLWARFPRQSFLGVTVADWGDDPASSDVPAFVDRLRHGEEPHFVTEQRFRHRFTMAGEPVYYRMVVAQKI